jgi:hypothetical protein
VDLTEHYMWLSPDLQNLLLPVLNILVLTLYHP